MFLALMVLIKMNLWGTGFHGHNGNYFIPFPQDWLDLKSEFLGYDLSSL